MLTYHAGVPWPGGVVLDTGSDLTPKGEQAEAVAGYEGNVGYLTNSANELKL